LGFEVVDSDREYERLITKYNLGFGGIDEGGPVDREGERMVRYARRVAEKLAKEPGNNGCVDAGCFISKLGGAVDAGKLSDSFAQHLITRVQSDVGVRWLSYELFRKEVFPLMRDLDDAEDFLKGKELVRHGDLAVVAREATRRRLERCIVEKKNLLIVETGGLLGKLRNMKNRLEEEGYGTFLVWVELGGLEDALRRNNMRKESGGRHLGEAVVERSFQVAAEVREPLLAEFFPEALVVDNSSDSEDDLAHKIEEVGIVIGNWMAGSF
jgi:predicted ABC-type ATPase